LKRAAFASGLALAAGAVSLAARPRPTPTPVPPPDPEAEQLFARAKDWWRNRKDLPYLQYGALIRYRYKGTVFENWWEASFRTSDAALHLEHIAIPEDDAKRLRGFPITFYGIKIFDTNKDVEPISVQAPYVEPISNFGLLTSYLSSVNVYAEPTPNPLTLPSPSATELHEIGRVQAEIRDYDVRIVGDENLRSGDATHLKLTPLRDPRTFRLRDLWIDKASGATAQLVVQGIYNGKPYDGVPWTVRYVPIDGRWYIQQLLGDDLHFGFGLEVLIDKMEIDFVDYHFPQDIPKEIFEKLLQ
jgi:hypothetical protein